VKRISTLTAAVTLAALALAVCYNTVIDGEPPPPEYTSPATVVKAVQISFNQRNIDYLKKSLSPNFVFYFDPRDVGQSPPGSMYIIPESWSRDEFLQAANNMFTKAYSISLAIPTAGVGTPGENETTYLADNVSISLLVMVDELNGFIADGGYCTFEFEKYTSKEGKKYWRLTGWWDRTSEGYDEHPGVKPASLGRILALFR